MCGILAVLGGSLPIEERDARAGLNLLSHRGPDDAGVWSSPGAWLGSRRLAILDVSPRGHQPMVDADSGVVVAYNGEIYNYVELRDELVRAGASFTSGCDTEVLLRSYLEWGTACVARFNGMFAFVVWDPRTQIAFFARDRLGVKPFVYTLARGRMSVASEPKALLHLYPELRAVDERAVYEFLGLGRLHASERTMYEGISVLPAATAGVLEPGSTRPKTWRYWGLPDDRRSVPASAEDFGPLFEDAVRLRMRSDVPVGISLSGGLDSTAVLHGAALAWDGSDPLVAFTSAFEGTSGRDVDERSWARSALEPYPELTPELVSVATEDWLPVLRDVVWHLDAPTYSPAVIPLWSIMRRARALGVKVMLEGQGGDELLGGYVHHAALSFPQGRSPQALVREIRSGAAAFGLGRFLLWTLRERVPALRHTYRRTRGTAATLSPEFSRRVESEFEDDAPVPRTLAARLRHDLTAAILPALLHYGDAVSMAHSIESRQPFLDFRVVELCASLHPSAKLENGETKRVLRDYLRSIGHDRIAERTDKIGFSTPIWSWLTADRGAVPRALLLADESRILQFCTRHGVRGLIDRTCRTTRGSGEHLFRLLSTELWLRDCVESDRAAAPGSAQRRRAAPVAGRT